MLRTLRQTGPRKALAATANIAVLCETEVVELLGKPEQGLHGVRWRNRRTGAEEQHAIAHLFLFTGADPEASVVPLLVLVQLSS